MESYDWSQHDDFHYENSEQEYAPLITTVDNKKVALIRINPEIYEVDDAGMWVLPIGTHLVNSVEDAVNHAFRRMFDEKKLNQYISEYPMNNDFFTCDLPDSHDPRGETVYVHTMVKSKRTWSKQQFNDHIRECQSNGTRPHWNHPGTHKVETNFYRFPVPNDDSNSSGLYLNMIRSALISEIRFFTEDEIEEAYYTGEISDITYKALIMWFDDDDDDDSQSYYLQIAIACIMIPILAILCVIYD